MPTLSAVWSQVTQLLEEGFSLIAVRDKQEGEFAAKSPYRDWKKYQSTIISKAELWEQMNTHNTTAIAVICGKISGNAEAIDIDVKNQPGIDAELFSAIKGLYPDLWERLRIHKTPSGGFHIPYKIIDKVPERNQKLASKGTKPVINFLETRGEAGYILLPPSLGYSVWKDRPWPFLTWEERCSLIAICKSFNQVTKPDKKQTTISKPDDYYDENPFQHFNRSPEALQVLTDNGWGSLQYETSKFAYYSRPGGSHRNIHATFIKEKSLYYFFTTNSEFEPDRCYAPTTVLAMLKFDGDYKKLLKYLVKSGYGRIKEAKEAKIVELSSLTGKNPPPNLSPKSLQALEEAKKAISEKYPHGLFWMQENDGFTIDREGLIRVSACMGFMYHNDEVIQQIGNMLHKRSERFYFDTLKQYIQEEDADISRELHNAYESFLQKSGSFTVTRLPLLDMDKVLKDTPTTCWKFYKNIALEIMGTGVIEYSYSDVTGLVWAERVQDRSYVKGPVGGRYHDFLERAAEYTKHLRKVIGYLAHEYKDTATGYIIVLTERVDDPTKGGGSGKNLFCDLLGLTTTITTKPGGQVKYDEKFMQSWNGERLMCISDVPKNFDFLFLKELATGSGLYKRLFINEQIVKPEFMPKLIVLTNYSYEVTDGGLKRRIIPVEFTDFFTLSGGVDTHYGILFPRDWTVEDWIGYDAVIIESVQEWLNAGRKLGAPVLTDTGWRKQFEQTYGHAITEFILENWDNWLQAGDVSLADFKKSLSDFYEEHNIQRNYQPSSFKINKGLREWAEKHGILFKENHPMRADGFVCKGKFFGPKAPF